MHVGFMIVIYDTLACLFNYCILQENNLWDFGCYIVGIGVAIQRPIGYGLTMLPLGRF